MKKKLFILLGFISILCGLFGILIPILPTTPFLLLAAYLFAKSSPNFYNWLISSRLFGPYIRNYREKRGMTLIHKVLVLILLWSVIITTMIYGTEHIWVRILLAIVAIAVSTHIFMIKTLKGEIYAENRTATVEQETN
jgi:hypothetical protein